MSIALTVEKERIPVSEGARYGVNTIAVGQRYIIGADRRSRTQVDLIGIWGAQLFFREVGKVPTPEEDDAFVIDSANVLEKHRIGRKRIIGVITPEERIASISNAQLEYQEQHSADPALTSARQVGKERLREGVEYLMRAITPAKDILVRNVKVEMRVRGMVFLSTDQNVDEELDVVTDKDAVAKLRINQGVLPVSNNLIKANSSEPGITFWRVSSVGA